MKDIDTIAHRVRAADADPQLVREVQMLERIAAGRVAHMATNGKFPNWSVERWLSFIGAILSGALMVIAWIFFAGGEWSSTKRQLDDISSEIRVLRDSDRQTQQRLWEMQQELKSIQRADEWVRKNPRGGQP